MADTRPKLRLVTEKPDGSGRPPDPEQPPAEQETANPLPDKYHSNEHHPFTDDEENDSDSEDDQ